MNKVITIIKREYLSRVRSKGFIIGTALSPLLLMSFVLIPMLVARGSGRAHYRLAVLDQTGDEALHTRVKELLTASDPRSDTYEVRREVVNSAEQLEARQQELNREMIEKKLDGYVVVPSDVLSPRGKIFYHTQNVSDFGRNSRISRDFNTAVIERRMTLEGIDAARVNELSKRIEMETINERGERERGQTVILAYALLMILYITILVYGIAVMRGVIEEKQSRIIEVLLSSVKPFQLMLGKLVGIGLVGLTQYLIWASFAVLISGLAAAQSLTFSSLRFPQVSLSLMVFFVLYFLLGYFLFATFYAMVGAIVSSEEDGQQVQMPVTMTIVIPVAISSIILRNPNSGLATALSLVPFFSPVLMFMRISIQPPPWWQIALSLLLLLATILGAVWVAAKIYRVGVLMYGKRPTLPELARWLRYT
jgi:ABC-2 type transport system permease protein